MEAGELVAGFSWNGEPSSAFARSTLNKWQRLTHGKKQDDPKAYVRKVLQCIGVEAKKTRDLFSYEYKRETRKKATRRRKH